MSSGRLGEFLSKKVCIFFVDRGGRDLAYYGHMAGKISRRRLAGLSTIPLLAAGQGQAAQAGPQDDMAIQRANLERWREQLKKAKLPMATEPAFQFKA